MATFTVNRKQSLVDVCLQLYGSTQFLFKLAKDNGLFIDSDLSRGSVLTYEPLFGNPDVKLVTESQGLKMVNPGVDLTTDLVVLDFDGIDDRVELDSAPDTTGNKIINFNLYLLKDSNYATINPLFALSQSENDGIYVRIINNEIQIFPKDTSFDGKIYSINGLSNVILNCQVNKGTGVINDFKINDVSQVSTGNVNTGTIIGNIGNVSLNYMYESFIWNLEIKSNLGVILHSWPGTGPNANTDAAWVDSVGGINGTVFGSPETRIIS